MQYSPQTAVDLSETLKKNLKCFVIDYSYYAATEQCLWLVTDCNYQSGVIIGIVNLNCIMQMFLR